MNLKPIATEKAVMKIESENVLTFMTELKTTKSEIKKEIEELFKVKIEKVSTQRRNNKKIAYVKLNKKFLAIDVATKLGMM
ncbi:MAG TPA: 50S ribosomal protein L23 [Candidatus Pacearchaeota archaeon]|nr:50S ribosomal protein L23 [Candidatus Pacearchaeota archaeon]